MKGLINIFTATNDELDLLCAIKKFGKEYVIKNPMGFKEVSESGYWVFGIPKYPDMKIGLDSLVNKDPSVFYRGYYSPTSNLSQAYDFLDLQIFLQIGSTCPSSNFMDVVCESIREYLYFYHSSAVVSLSDLLN